MSGPSPEAVALAQAHRDHQDALDAGIEQVCDVCGQYHQRQDLCAAAWKLRETARAYRDVAIYRTALGYRDDAVALRIGAKRLESKAWRIERSVR